MDEEWLKWFWAKFVRMENGCLEWQGDRTEKGYGRVRTGTRAKRRVNRVVWEIMKGPIPPGLMVCHKCDNPPCGDLEHLFLGTAGENARDCAEKGRTHKRTVLERGSCKRGHVLAGENLRWVKRPNGRKYPVCRECAAGVMRRQRARRGSDKIA